MTEGQRIPEILFNTDHSQNLFEHTAAHELGHVVQFYEGYPHLQSVRPPGNVALSQSLGAIAEEITDLVMDPDTERHLKPNKQGRY